MKIVFFEVEEWERETFKPLEKEHEVVYVAQPLTKNNLSKYQSAEILSVFIYSDLSKEMLKRFNNLQLVTTRSTGFDHIDINYCSKNKIPVCNVPTYGENTVAEHVFALLLTISHRMIEAVDRTKKGDFSSRGLRGFDLRGKTIGVIGTGHIGAHVIRMAKGFEMDVIAYDAKPNKKLASSLSFTYVEKDELLKEADIISLHIPGSKSNVNYLSKKEFNQMKKGAVLINTSRGDVIDVQALLQALVSGKIHAAGLDVLPEEPLLKEEAELLRTGFRKEHNLETLLANHVLINMRNVVITPHSAFNTTEAVQRILDTTLKNIMSFLKRATEEMNLLS